MVAILESHFIISMKEYKCALNNMHQYSLIRDNLIFINVFLYLIWFINRNFLVVLGRSSTVSVQMSYLQTLPTYILYPCVLTHFVKHEFLYKQGWVPWMDQSVPEHQLTITVVWISGMLVQNKDSLQVVHVLWSWRWHSSFLPQKISKTPPGVINPFSMGLSFKII
jgi:hypothetical protein